MTIKSIMKNTRRTEEEVDAIIDDILDENQENDFDAIQPGSCPGGCEDLNDAPKETARQCKCGVENSSRFSLRVMEAMRLLQRDVDQPSTSSAEDIVDYIRTNYRNDGDLYAQVRTALRQVCSQGFVVEVLNNEYHLIGPVVSLKRNGCSLNCKGRVTTVINDTSRRRKTVNNHRYSVCRCERFPRRPPRQDPKSLREESLRSTFIDRPEDLSTEPIFHSTSIPIDERDNADYRDGEFDEEVPRVCGCKDTPDIRNDNRRRDITGTREVEQRDQDAEPIPGPSRGFVRVPSPIPARNAKKARIDDQRVRRTDETETEESTTEEDADNEVVQVTRDEHSRRRPLDRTRVIRNGGRREIADEEDERVEEEDEDTDDSAYRDLRAREPRRRNGARERELRNWIRRCREECERRRQMR